MSISVELSREELAALQNVTRENDQAAAVREFLRVRQLSELISISGHLELEDNWRELEAAELAEVGFPEREETP